MRRRVGERFERLGWLLVATPLACVILAPGSMPPLATRNVDAGGAGLIAEWIHAQSDCPRE